MNPGLLDMLHDAGDVDVRAVGDGVDVDFGGVGEIAVEQNRRVARDLTASRMYRASWASSRTISIARPPST